MTGTAPDYVLHYAPDNASLIVRLMLEELRLPYRTALVDRSARQQDNAGYRTLNPAGLIPALETPDGPIFETAAILLWLSERHGAMAPAPGSADRAGFLKWLFFTSNTLHADLRMLFYPERHAGAPEAVPAFAAATRARISRHLALLDAMAATQPAWFRPDTPSVLTCYLPPLLRWVALYPQDTAGWFDLAAVPALHAVAAAMETRPSARAAAEAEGLGATIFTHPSYACPPEGSAT
ncbi:glutathione S-transferase family protein [Defluviimonas sp. SAOS-178_SWC]|uniref:glutathione S-transferase family protein n=1 Tax=Defluviimonas sp. SAOS-178_SWC TaxID=3121287 RepID=UPI003221FCD8